MTHNLTFLIPVGTSLLANAAKPIPAEHYRNNYQIAKEFVDQIVTKLPSVADSFSKRSQNKKDRNPAEISSLHAFIAKKTGEIKDCTIKVILLHSANEGKACAEGVQRIIKNKMCSPPGLNNTIDWKCEMEGLSGLDPKNAGTFPEALDSLAKKINEEIAAHPDAKLYINITGGYKALVPYLTMMGMTMGGHVCVFYLFEESTEIIELPVYPLSFDLMAWRDWRGLLLPFTLDIGINNSQKEDLWKALKQTRMSDLITKDRSFSLNTIGQLLEGLYRKTKGRGFSEFGEGGLLLNQFSDSSPYPDYLIKKCIPIWRHLSAGDHIPETVEHGRGHVQRLLELAQQLLIAAEIPLNDEQLFVLVSSIWLHDLGHSGDCLFFEGDGMLIQDKDDTESTSRFSVYGDPDKVRKYHNFLSYELIKKERGFLFPDISTIDGDSAAVEPLLRSVELACLYHRRAMPTEGAALVDQCRVSKGIKNFGTDDNIIEGFSLIAALLRFLDGAENQEERTGSSDYYKVMKWVLNRQVEFMKEEQRVHNGDMRLEKESKFKAIQKDHFLKHSMVRNVFLVREEEGGLDGKGIYGKSCSSNGKTVIGAYIVANSEKAEYSRKKVIKEIISEFLDEFLLVSDILPFRLAIVLVEKDCREYSRQQVIIQQEKWSYDLVAMDK